MTPSHSSMHAPEFDRDVVRFYCAACARLLLRQRSRTLGRHRCRRHRLVRQLPPFLRGGGGRAVPSAWTDADRTDPRLRHPDAPPRRNVPLSIARTRRKCSRSACVVCEGEYRVACVSADTFKSRDFPPAMRTLIDRLPRLIQEAALRRPEAGGMGLTSAAISASAFLNRSTSARVL